MPHPAYHLALPQAHCVECSSVEQARIRRRAADIALGLRNFLPKEVFAQVSEVVEDFVGGCGPTSVPPLALALDSALFSLTDGFDGSYVPPPKA